MIRSDNMTKLVIFISSELEGERARIVILISSEPKGERARIRHPRERHDREIVAELETQAELAQMHRAQGEGRDFVRVVDLVVVQSHETNRVAVLECSNDGHSTARANLIVMEQQPFESFERARSQRLRDRLRLRISPPQPAEVEQGRTAHDALELCLV